ncbi:pentatricopeptide repeat-containing protein At1g62260, mitochondrial [Impatiens glandulifera]|uniref:pentatricopeptide repeat-containing protein At1g62260, mitochondrial n=1 Tax=Impatiens glandulifera TaxID=253017 RepID=UPI001FB05434|nr:pentatricopeptide repeat-containing protein At1g62260, mitochondrial [Impatiens glandulifera]
MSNNDGVMGYFLPTIVTTDDDDGKGKELSGERVFYGSTFRLISKLSSTASRRKTSEQRDSYYYCEMFRSKHRSLHLSCRRFYFHLCLSSLSSTNASHDSQLRQLNKKIMQLNRAGRFQEARTLFDEANHKNTVTWNSIISGYVKTREMIKARQLFDEMPERDLVSWNTMISGYLSCLGRAYIEEGKRLFDLMPERDIISWNTMISGYARNGRMDYALHYFNKMPDRNVVSWNAVISGFLQNCDVKNAIETFNRMPNRDAASLSGLVAGLVQNGELDKAASFLHQTGKDCVAGYELVDVYNTLIAGYGQKGMIHEARRLFDEIPSNSPDHLQRNEFIRNMISWNSMIMCYVRSGDVVSARDLFDQMVDRDIITWNTMISGYVHISQMDQASDLFQKMPNPDTQTWNTMISGYAQIGKLDLARDSFEKTPHKNCVSWNSIISGYEKNNDHKGAIKLFIRMQSEGNKPDRHTLSSLLAICSEFVSLELGVQIHQLVVKIVVPDSPLNNSLITMYARCGAIDRAESIFDEMKFKKDVISWNAMIGGYASDGSATKALELFTIMKSYKIRPTYITFISVLSACAHAGLVEEGRRQFKSMVCEYGIEARVEHYASLVDVIGRYGDLDGAMDVIKGMHMEPDKAVWGAILGACRMHNNVELARFAADELMRIEPESSAPYVLLYNMYADAERWEEASRVRMLMDDCKIVKHRGYSLVNFSAR